MTLIAINRTKRYSDSIGGTLHVDGKFVCHTLELPWRWNKKNISCIPAGTYTCFWRHDRGRVQLHDIPADEGKRIAVQIHSGNKPSHSQGCILVGTASHPNQLVDSRTAMRRLEAAIFGEEVGPAYRSKPITVTIEGVIMNSVFDDLDSAPGADVKAMA